MADPAHSQHEAEQTKNFHRSNGDLLAKLDHHEYIVWTVKIWLDQIFTASYDCSIAYLNFNAFDDTEKFEIVQKRHIHGPEIWADAMACDATGNFMATHDDINFQLDIWNLRCDHEKPFLQLSGHTDEVLLLSYRQHTDTTVVNVRKKSNPFHDQNLLYRRKKKRARTILNFDASCCHSYNSRACSIQGLVYIASIWY